MLTKVQDQINQLTQEKLDNNVKEIDLWISFFVYLTYNKVKGSVFMIENLPTHIGIIMDGNGRWATSRGLKRSMGHKEGAEAFRKTATYIFDLGIKYLSVFAFSTENFKRDKEEVDYLMNLFILMFNTKMDEIYKRGVKVVFSGSRENLSKEVNAAMDKIINKTKDNTNGVLNICLNYGGQDEIKDMAKKISTLVKNGEIDVEDITNDLVNKYLYNELPPLDLVIRTSGEQRISNFMLYQSAYAEYYFPMTLFPDFDEKEVDIALEEFSKRNRRFGGVKK